MERSPGLLLRDGPCPGHVPQNPGWGGCGGVTGSKTGESGPLSHGRVMSLPARPVADCSCGRDSEVSAVSPAALSVPGQARLLRSAGCPVAACARPLGARWWAAGACDRRPPWARWGFSVAVSDTGQASVWGALTSGSVELSFTQPAGCSAPHFPGVLLLQLLRGRTPASAGLSAVLPLRLRAVL